MRSPRGVVAVATLLALVAAPALAQDAAYLSAFQAAVLAKHNEYRARHGVAPLRLSPVLQKYARERAEAISKLPGLSAGHAGLQAGYGENLYWGGVSQNQDFPTGARAAEQALSSWYNEIKDYDFANPGFKSGTGHFTQVVWKGTTEVGCAVLHVTERNGKPTQWKETYVVCNYKAPGNVMGQFPTHVLKPK